MIAVVVVAERVDRRLPGALIGLVAATAAVSALDLRSHGVAVLGAVAHAAPHVGLHGVSLHAVEKVVPLAGLVALVVVSQSAATTRAFADHEGYEVDVGRDFLGVGAGRIAAGLVGAFPVNASPPRTAAVAEAGGRTQAAGLAAAGGPGPARAGRRCARGRAARRARRHPRLRRHPDRARPRPGRDRTLRPRRARPHPRHAARGGLVGVEQGLAVAVGLAILDRTRRSARPQLHVLGRIPETTSWVPLSADEDAEQLPGVLVVLFATPLWYANAAHFRAQLEESLARGTGELRVVILDAIGMSDVDYTGAHALARALDHLDQRHVAFAVARAGSHLRRGLARSGLLARIGESHVYPSVGEAVAALHRET